MSHVKSTDTDYHRNVENMRSELLSSSPPARHRSSDRQALGGSRAATLGLRPLAGGAAPSSNWDDGDEEPDTPVVRRVRTPIEGLDSDRQEDDG